MRMPRVSPLLCLTYIAVLGACRVSPSVAPAERRAAVADSLVRAAIRAERAFDPARLSATTVGVLPLRVETRDSTLRPLGHGLAALLVADLAQSARLTLVERLRTDAVLRELGLAASGRIDSATAPRVGHLAGARRLVLGTVVVEDGAGDARATTRRPLVIETRVADVVSGAVAAGGPARATLDDILDAEKALAFRLFEQLGVALTPRERARVEQRPTRSLAALLAFSRGAEAEAARDFGTAVRQYQQAVRLDPGFTAARTQLRQIDPRAGIAEPATALQRATAAAAEAVNRPLPAIVGTAADAPLQAVQQTVTVTVRVRVP